MAISIQYPSPYGGEEFTYFIVGEVKENRYYSNAEITMYGFVHAEARHANAACISVRVNIPTEQWIKDATIGEIYDLIKQAPEFAEASDV